MPCCSGRETHTLLSLNGSRKAPAAPRHWLQSPSKLHLTGAPSTVLHPAPQPTGPRQRSTSPPAAALPAAHTPTQVPCRSSKALRWLRSCPEARAAAHAAQR